MYARFVPLGDSLSISRRFFVALQPFDGDHRKIKDGDMDSDRHRYNDYDSDNESDSYSELRCRVIF